ncbi:LysE family translocator [Saccharopolyspora karakumensis]|uniref:LysE family translocator n=1 Tax=Saccharopolyspora karakumensis TaxID=2530386 RepID=A0A4R5BCF2_9PSEU|nr:LysE family translocator [Saccharopolyspora karakumensis]
MPEHLLPFLVVVVVLTVVPGPDTALGLRNSLRGGSTAMWWTGLGVCSGMFVHAAASVVGLSAVLAASAEAYAVVKLAGAAYLLWLGASTLWKTWCDRHQYASALGARSGDGVRIDRRAAFRQGFVIDRRTAFRQGFVSDLLNPKIALLFLTLLPQFIGPTEPRALTSVVLTLVFVAVALLWWRLTSWLVGAIRKALARDNVRHTLETTTGAAMLLLGTRTVLDTTTKP